MGNLCNKLCNETEEDLYDEKIGWHWNDVKFLVNLIKIYRHNYVTVDIKNREVVLYVKVGKDDGETSKKYFFTHLTNRYPDIYSSKLKDTKGTKDTNDLKYIRKDKLNETNFFKEGLYGNINLEVNIFASDELKSSHALKSELTNKSSYNVGISEDKTKLIFRNVQNEVNVHETFTRLNLESLFKKQTPVNIPNRLTKEYCFSNYNITNSIKINKTVTVETYRVNNLFNGLMKVVKDINFD
jgi:hypothetical protein